MKMLMIAYNEALDADVMEVLQKNAVDGYTKWTKVMGAGRSSGPHLLTHVWSKGNNAVMCCTADEKADAILAAVRELRKTLGADGIKAFKLPVEEAT